MKPFLPFKICKVLFVLSLFSIITVGCANAKHPEKEGKPVSGGIAAGNVEPTLTYDQQEKDSIFHFQLKNQTEHIVTYHFPTSQRFDYVIKTADGIIVKQFSKNHLFTQVLGGLKLKQAETADFTATVSGLKPGQYTISFWLTAKEDQPKVKLSFTIK